MKFEDKNAERFNADHPEHAEELEQLAGRLQYEDGKSQSAAEFVAMMMIKDKYNIRSKHEN